MPLLCNLEPLIACKINATSSGTTSNDLLATVVAMDQYTQERDNSVIEISCLPNLSGTNNCPGNIVFVHSLCAPVVSSCRSWYSLDGKIVRRDEKITSLYAEGQNTLGQLGDGTTTTRTSPVSVVGGFTDWCSLAVGACHTAAIRINGTLWAWGCNSSGELGIGVAGFPTGARSSPTSVVGGFTDWSRVSSGLAHTAALRTNGTLWTWGINGFGSLGDRTSIDRSSPVSVASPTGAAWIRVSTRQTSTYGITTNSGWDYGPIWAWGNSGGGRLGNNVNLVAALEVCYSSPVSVVGGFTDWCEVSAGSLHAAAIRSNGTLWAWGCNQVGTIGDGTSIDRSSPVSVVGGFTDWCQVSAGSAIMSAIRTNGSLWTWGSNFNGELGNNTAAGVSSSSPVSVVGGFTDWCNVCSAYAIRTNGTLWAWGGGRSSPVSVAGGFTDWCRVSAGANHWTALRARYEP